MTSIDNGLPVLESGGQMDFMGGSAITTPTSTDFRNTFSDMAAWAAEYARGGWRIFPLHTLSINGCSCGNANCSNVAKHPRIMDWQHAATSHPETVAAWWAKFPDANIGLSLDGLCCLDIDPRHDGDQSLTALENKHARLERVGIQLSGSGGHHFLFKPAQRHVPIRRGFRPGLDWLVGSGCYIVAAPPLHASGGRYEWLKEPNPLSVDRKARRRIPMSQRGAAVLEMRRTGNESRWVFPAPTKSGHMEPSTVKKPHAKACKGGAKDDEKTGMKRFDVQPFPLYTLRHTCLTRWAPHMDPWTLAHLAGHRDMAITKRYVNPQAETIRAAIERARVPVPVISEAASPASTVTPSKPS